MENLYFLTFFSFLSLVCSFDLKKQLWSKVPVKGDVPPPRYVPHSNALNHMQMAVHRPLSGGTDF
jgi:hypothetical protein